MRLLQEALNELKLVSQLELLAQDRAVLNELFLLTLKPRMYVLNVSEDALAAANDLLARIAAGKDVDVNTLESELQGIVAVARRAKEEGSEVVAVSARLESELTELPEEDAHEYLESLGLPQLGADRVIQVGYRLLNLITNLAINEAPLADLASSDASEPEAADDSGRSAQKFLIEAVVHKGSEMRRATAAGRDIYAITAPLVCEALDWTLSSRARTTGMVSAGELFDAPAFLGAMSRNHLDIHFQQELAA